MNISMIVAMDEDGYIGLGNIYLGSSRVTYPDSRGSQKVMDSMR